MSSRVRSLSLVLVLSFLASIFTLNPSHAAGLSVSFPSTTHGFFKDVWSSVASTTGTTPEISGDATGAAIRVTVTSSDASDRLRLAVVTGISAARGFTLSDFNTAGDGLAEIAFEGSRADASSALGSLELKVGSDVTSTISVSILDGVGTVFGGHYYEAVASGTVWKDGSGWTISNPRTAAVALTNGTCNGYLVNITSAEENAVAQELVPDGAYAAWIGATDRGNTTNEWEWLDGPEAGVIFYKKSDSTYNLDYYNNWGGVEPNNYATGDGTRDDYAYILQNGTWADTTYASASSIVEYGDSGCTPNLSAASASFSAVTVVVAGLPTSLGISFPTADSATLSFAAPTNNGGGDITSYLIDYETGSGWISVSPSLLTGTISGVTRKSSFTFRVAAVNAAGTGPYSTLSYSPPKPFAGPIASGLARKVLAEDESTTIIFTGIRLDLVTKITVEGVEIEILEQNQTSISCLIPALSSGTKDILLYSPLGNVTHQDVLLVIATPEVASSTSKVNAGSFKGFVAVYAKGHEGSRLSAKVGNDWIIVPSIPAATNDLYRLVDFTGAGVDVAVRIYIDRVLVDTINLTTR